MARRKSYKNPLTEFLKRAARSMVAVIVLTALVLGISFGVKEVSTLDAAKLAQLSGPVLSKVGITEEQAGQVAGKFIARLGQTDLGVVEEGDAGTNTQQTANQNPDLSLSPQGEVSSASTERNEAPLFKVAVFADSHIASNPSEYTENESLLVKASDRAQSEGVAAIFHVGDISNLGLSEDISTAKRILDASGITYYAIPGDRDLWKTVGPENFISVFGDNFHAVDIQGTKFVMLDNSANYSVVDGETVGQFEKELEGADFVLVSQPLYHTNNIVMGVVDGETVVKVKEQADVLLGMIRSSEVKAVIAGDQHTFSKLKDPQDPGLEHIVAGPITRERNLQQGKPRILILNVYKDGGYSVNDVALE